MKKALLILGGLGLIGFAGYAYFKKQIKLLSDFRYKIVGFSIVQVSENVFSFTVKIRFISDSSIEATISKLYLDVLADGAQIGFITEIKEFIVPANGSTDIDLFFSVKPKGVLGNIIGILTGALKQKDIMLSFKGYAKISSGFISTTIPVDYTTGIKQYF